MGELHSASTLLNEKERTAIRLIVIDKYTQREAARLLGTSQPMVCRYLQTGLARLRTVKNIVLDAENF